MKNQLPPEFVLSRRHRSFGFAAIALMKVAMFAFFAWQFYVNSSPELVTGGIAISSGDTSGYYEPVEQFVKGNGYSSVCRMPGLLPVYAPMYALFGAVSGKAAVIILQLIMQISAVWLLALLTARFTQSVRGYYVMIALMGVSTFLSIRDHMLLSDSFAVSFLLFALFFLLRSLDQKSKKWMLVSGFFLAWAVFFRPISLVFYVPVALLIILHSRFQLLSAIRTGWVFAVPLVLSIGAWTVVNYQKTQKLIPLQGPVSECFGYLSPENLAIRKLIIRMGEDYMSWSAGSAAQWFFVKSETEPTFNPFEEVDFTPDYDLDSLRVLRANYLALDTIGVPELRKEAGARVIARVEQFDASLCSHRPLQVYVLNRLTLFRNLVFPSRLDDLPFPALAQMSFYHKAIKGGSLLLLLLVNVLGMLAWLRACVRRDYWLVILGLIPIIVMVLLGPILGFVEQRYLVPAYPILMWMCVTTVLNRTSRTEESLR